MSYGQLLRIVWRRKLVAVLIATVVTVSAGAFLLRQPAEYRSSATVVLLPNGDDLQAATYYGEISKTLIPAYAELIKSRTFLDGVARRLPFPATGRQLEGDVFVLPEPSAAVLRINGRAARPGRAAAIAAATVASFQEAVADNRLVAVRLADEPQVPEAPVSPNRRMVIVAAVMLGLLAGAAGGLAWERLFGRIRDLHDLAGTSAVPVLGAVPRHSSLAAGPHITTGDPAAADLNESWRRLGANLVFEMEQAKARSVAITSLRDHEGKSLLAANLAVVLGELGLEVLLVDAHLRAPAQNHVFRLSNDKGLSSAALNGSRADTFARQSTYAGVRVLVAGPMLSSRREELDVYLQQVPRLVEAADVIVVDAPALRVGADVRLLVSSVGAVILAVRAGSATPAEVREALENLRLPETHVLGTVLTWSRPEH